MAPVGPILCSPSPINRNRRMYPIVVVVNLISLIEVIPKDLTIVESFGHQLPTCSLVPLLCIQPLQMLQRYICCHHSHHLVGTLYCHNMTALPSYWTLIYIHISNLIVLHVPKNLLCWNPLRPVTPLLN